VVLVLNGAFSVIVLWPRKLAFAFDARETYSRLYSDDVAEAQLRVAYSARDRYEYNKRTIDRLEFAFQAAVVTLGLQTLLWTLALAVAS